MACYQTNSTPSLKPLRHTSQNLLFENWNGVRTNALSVGNVLYDAKRLGLGQTFSTVQLRTFSMPTMFNIVDWSDIGSLKNNLFTINYNNTGDSGQFLQPGSYDGFSLAATLETTIAQIIGSNDITVTYDPSTAKLSFQSASSTPFSLVFNSFTPWYEMGFAPNSTAVSSGTGFLMSTYAVNLQWSSQILIYIPELNGTFLNMVANSPTSWAVTVSAAGNWENHFSYLIDGPSHINDQGIVKQLTDFTVNLRFTRAGVIYEIRGDGNTTYSIGLMFTTFTTA